MVKLIKADPIKAYTSQQLQMAGWLRDVGLGFQMEVLFHPYVADIYIEDLTLIIELDGPDHRQKRDQERDQYLLDTYGLTVWRYKNEWIRESNKSIFVTQIIERADKLANA